MATLIRGNARAPASQFALPCGCRGSQKQSLRSVAFADRILGNVPPQPAVKRAVSLTLSPVTGKKPVMQRVQRAELGTHYQPIWHYPPALRHGMITDIASPVTSMEQNFFIENGSMKRLYRSLFLKRVQRRDVFA